MSIAKSVIKSEDNTVITTESGESFTIVKASGEAKKAEDRLIAALQGIHNVDLEQQGVRLCFLARELSLPKESIKQIILFVYNESKNENQYVCKVADRIFEKLSFLAAERIKAQSEKWTARLNDIDKRSRLGKNYGLLINHVGDNRALIFRDDHINALSAEENFEEIDFEALWEGLSKRQIEDELARLKSDFVNAMQNIVQGENFSGRAELIKQANKSVRSISVYFTGNDAEKNADAIASKIKAEVQKTQSNSYVIQLKKEDFKVLGLEQEKFEKIHEAWSLQQKHEADQTEIPVYTGRQITKDVALGGMISCCASISVSVAGFGIAGSFTVAVAATAGIFAGVAVVAFIVAVALYNYDKNNRAKLSASKDIISHTDKDADNNINGSAAPKSSGKNNNSIYNSKNTIFAGSTEHDPDSHSESSRDADADVITKHGAAVA